MNSEWAETPKDQDKLATPGAQLAAQRQAMGLSVEQVADQLKLAPRQVVALEAGDYASLPNMAVTRGFVRAYAKVLKLDAAPLVAMIEVTTDTSSHDAPPAPRRDKISATFSESRFPSMTERSSNTTGWIAGVAVVAVAAAAFGAYQAGLLPASLLGQTADVAATTPAATPTAPIETTTAKPGADAAPLISPNVPLISVPPPADTAAPAPAAAAATPAATPAVPPATTPAAPQTAPAAAPTAAAMPAATPAAAPAAAGVLVLTVQEDSWIEIRRAGKASLISRLVKAGSTETFDISGQALLIVGKPAGVQATLRGAPLALPPVAGGTIARVTIQ